MQFVQDRWRNYTLLVVVWGLLAFFFIQSSVLYWREVQGYQASGLGLMETVELFEGFPSEVKLGAFILSTVLFVSYTLCAGWQVVRGQVAFSPWVRRYLYGLQAVGLLVLSVLSGIGSLALGKGFQLVMLVILLALLVVLKQRRGVARAEELPTTFPFASWEDALQNGRLFWGMILAGGAIYLLLARLTPITVNPDSYAYLQIARRIADGELVVRGHWSPGISWLSAPLIAAGLTPQTAFKATLALVDLGIIGAALRLAVVMGLSRLGQVLVVIMAAGLALRTTTLVNADSLGTLFVVLFWAISLDKRTLQRPWRYGLLMGAVGGLAYLAKAYNLSANFIYLPLWGALLWLHGRALKPVLIAGGTALVMMLVVAAPWIAGMESRYGVLTVANSSRINARGPESETGLVCNDGTRLCPEPDDILFPWEDQLVEYMEPYNWSRTENIGNFTFAILQSGYWFFALYVAHLTIFTLLIVLFLLAALVFWQSRERRLLYGWLFIMAFWYPAGYLIRNTAPWRYFIPMLVMFAVGSVLVLRDTTHVLRLSAANRQRMMSLMMGVVLLFTASEALSLYRYGPSNPQDEKPFCPELANYADQLEAPMASVEPRSFFSDVQELAYYTQVRTYGSLSEEWHDAATIAEQMAQHGVQTLLVEDEALARTLIEAHDYVESGRVTSQACDVNLIVLKPR